MISTNEFGQLLVTVQMLEQKEVKAFLELVKVSYITKEEFLHLMSILLDRVKDD